MTKLPATQNKSKKILKVGVFMGGPSSEREISLESGRHVYNMLDRERFTPTPMFMDTQNKFWLVPEHLIWMNTATDIQAHLDQAQEIPFEDLKQYIDFAFLALHGKFGEDGSLQGLLEILEIPYNGPGVLTSALGMDKFYQRKILRAAGLHVPKYLGTSLTQWKGETKTITRRIAENIGFPCVIKPSREGCSTGLTVAKKDSQLDAAIKEASRWDNLILIEEDLSQHLEITTTVIGNQNPQALLPTHTPRKGDYLTVQEKFLPGDASMITPPKIPKSEIEQIQRETIKAYQALGCQVYTRIDAFWTGQKLIILEPNTLPGVTPSTMVFHQAAEAGMTPTGFFTKIIELSLEAHSQKRGPL